jgi:hypothetical protein
MIAVALVPRDKVREQLRELGCEFVERIDERTDGYKTSWGFAFTVPAIGDDGMCPKSALFEVFASIERSRLK